MTSIKKLKDSISILQSKIEAKQNKCKHPKKTLTEKTGSDVGNWDRSADSWWIDYHCGVCDKKWTEEKG